MSFTNDHFNIDDPLSLGANPATGGASADRAALVTNAATDERAGERMGERAGASGRGWQPRAGGKMGAMIRAFDWGKTCLGPMETWPLSLRVALELCLNSRFPILIWWGEELINLYNDAYAPMMGSRHPGGLGVSARELWREIWDDIGPQTEAVLLRGESTWNERRLLMLERNGYPEECYFTWSYSPILDGSGRAVGIFCAVTEETARVLAERERDQFAERYALQSRRFEKMLSSIQDLAYVYNLQGQFIFANKRLLDIWGMTMEEAYGKTFADLNYPPELAAKLQRQIQQVIQTHQPVVDETMFTDRRGHTGYYEYIYSPIIGTDGEVEAIAGVTRELTERKRVEEERERLSRAIERERANLAAIIEQSPAFIAVLRGPDHVYEMANERYYEIAGRRDLIGKTVRQAFPDIAGQGFYELLDQVYRTGQTFTGNEMPILLTLADGTAVRRYARLVYQALRDGEQRISGIIVHGIDLTEMVESRQSLKEAEEFHRFTAEAGRVGAWNADLDTMVARFSPTMCELVGMPPVQRTLKFEEWFSRVSPEHQAGMRDAISAAIERDIPYEYEFQITMPDGSRRWLASRGGVLRDAAGKPSRLHGATVDITDKRLHAEEREALLASERLARAQAEQANRAKDKFLAVLSHELRTPLSPVVMTIPAIESDAELPEKFREDMAMIRRNIELEVKLIEDLLDLSRIATGKLSLQTQSVNVHDLLRHVVQSSAIDAVNKRLALTESYRATNDRISGDPARLQQVFWNLIRNAIKFTPDGGRVWIRTADSADGSRLIVEVEDSGVGIAPDVLPRVFDAFEQGEARVTRQFGGLGLGLAISKAVVEMHGGAIRADSPGRGEGATFRVELKTAPSEKTAAVSGGLSPAERPQSERRRILLVEDHPDTSRTMSRLLKSFGFAVRTAENVSMALQILDGEPFDVVVSDIGLPDATGYELMREVRRRHNIKGVALSGYGMEEDIRKSHDAGFSEHLVKPIDIGQLQVVLKRVIGTGEGN
jgi:PAS domain S-box-containing protein